MVKLGTWGPKSPTGVQGWILWGFGAKPPEADYRGLSFPDSLICPPLEKILRAPTRASQSASYLLYVEPLAINVLDYDDVDDVNDDVIV